jgi:neutral ceramidase
MPSPPRPKERPLKPGRRRLLKASALALAAQSLGTRGRPAAATPTLSPSLRAGAAELVVTPDAVGTYLIGPLKPSTGTHDELFARALVIDDGASRVVLVTLDYLGFDLAYTQQLIRAASEGGGVTPAQVVLNCSHTHSAPLSVPWGPWREHRSEAFYDVLPNRVRDVVRQAVDRLRPASLRSHQAPVQIGLNRRLLHVDRVIMATNPAGAVVPWTDVLAVDGTDGQPIAVFFTFAAHPVIVHSTSTLISAEYPGFAIERLKEARGTDAVFLFGQGCAGNVNAFPWKGGLEAARAAGRELGEAVLRALELPPRTRPSGALAVSSVELALPLQAPPEPAALETMIAKERSEERRRNFERLLALARSGRPPDPIGCPLRAFALGAGMCLVGMPHEPFAEYHHHLLAISPYTHTFALGYTNGMQAYLPTESDLRLGARAGYEASTTGAAFMYDTLLPVVPESERMIHAGLERLLADLKEA